MHHDSRTAPRQPAAAVRRKSEAQKRGAKARRRALWLFSTLLDTGVEEAGLNTRVSRAGYRALGGLDTGG